jgi:hypothetical protein
MSLTETIVRKLEMQNRVRYPSNSAMREACTSRLNPNGSKLWYLKHRFASKEKRLAFGHYPTVTLAMAREQRTEAQRLLRDNVDPGERKKQEKGACARAAKVAAANSFEAAAREWFPVSEVLAPMGGGL